jgi:hypothetical protein
LGLIVPFSTALVSLTLDAAPVVTAGEAAATAIPLTAVAATTVAATTPILRFMDTSSK